MLNKEKFNKCVLEASRQKVARQRRRDLYYNSFNIQTDILPVGVSLEITEDFFNHKIIPCFQKKVYKRPQKLRDFFLLTANLFYASKKRPLIISLNQNDYDNNSDLSRFVIALKRILEDNGYITIKAGHHDRAAGKSFVTRVWPTDKLITELFNHPDLPAGFHVESNKNLIVLSESIKEINANGKMVKKRKELKFRRTRYTNLLEKDLQLINDVNRQHAVELQVTKPPQMLMTDLHAVFNGTLNYGGRFYTRKKVGYQALYKDDRPEITINGNKTIELDYRGLHPYLLYASVGIQYEGDPYNAIDARSALRDVLKVALLTLLNSESETQMKQAGNYDLFNEREHFLLMKKYTLTIKDLLQKFKEVHASIAQYFCTGQGLQLMNIDSNIARAVLLHFAEKKEACLCIHDSFIVEQKNADQLKQVMKKTYKEVTAELFTGTKTYHCPIKIS